jgi:periplasmic protein CpxP/Spy
MRFLLSSLFAVVLLAQGPPPGGGAGPGDRQPMERSFPGSPQHSRWWTNPAVVQQLSITPDQLKKIDDIFQKSRLKLIDLNAALQKEEAILEPLLSMDHPDEARASSQIDRVAQARAELEKANARMLLGVRLVLTSDQWKQLQARQSRPPGSARQYDE